MPVYRAITRAPHLEKLICRWTRCILVTAKLHPPFSRLARSTWNFLNTLATIIDRKTGFRSLGKTWTDTTTLHSRLMLTVLGGLAEFKRELMIRVRTGEGRQRVKACGVKLGRPLKMTPHQVNDAPRPRDTEDPMRDIARAYNVSHSMISRIGYRTA